MKLGPSRAVRPSDHVNVLAPTPPSKYSPIQPHGHGNQGAYLSEVDEAMAAALRSFIGAEWELRKRTGSFYRSKHRIWTGTTF